MLVFFSSAYTTDFSSMPKSNLFQTSFSINEEKCFISFLKIFLHLHKTFFCLIPSDRTWPESAQRQSVSVCLPYALGLRYSVLKMFGRLDHTSNQWLYRLVLFGHLLTLSNLLSSRLLIVCTVLMRSSCGIRVLAYNIFLIQTGFSFRMLDSENQIILKQASKRSSVTWIFIDLLLDWETHVLNSYCQGKLNSYEYIEVCFILYLFEHRIGLAVY